MRLLLLWSLFRGGPERSKEQALLLREECGELSELCLRRETVLSRGEVAEHERTVAFSMQSDHWCARVRKDPANHSIFALIHPSSELITLFGEKLCTKAPLAGFYARGELLLESGRVLRDSDTIFPRECSLWMQELLREPTFSREEEQPRCVTVEATDRVKLLREGAGESPFETSASPGVSVG